MNYLIRAGAIAVLAATGVFAQIQPASSTTAAGTEAPMLGQGMIDWQNRIVIAVGIGSPNTSLPQSAQRPGAIRAAQVNSFRNALEMIKGIAINSSTTVENTMTTSDVITTQVNGFVKGFEQQGKTKYMSDGTVEITMRLPLDEITGTVLGEQLGEKPSVTKFDGPSSKKKTVFSGLIIDCRGLKIKPALSPRVLDESGKEVYGSAYVSREWAVKYGMVGYSKDVAAAVKLERVGSAPGQIKAAKAVGPNSTDIVLSNTDAADVRSASENLKFLSECRVVFVID